MFPGDFTSLDRERRPSLVGLSARFGERDLEPGGEGVLLFKRRLVVLSWRCDTRTFISAASEGIHDGAANESSDATGDTTLAAADLPLLEGEEASVTTDFVLLTMRREAELPCMMQRTRETTLAETFESE